MDSMAIIAFTGLVTNVICLFAVFTMYRLIHIVFQIERDRVFQVNSNTKHIEGLWATLDSVGVSTKFKEMVLKNIEAELSGILESSTNDKANSPGEQSPKKSPREAGP